VFSHRLDETTDLRLLEIRHAPALFTLVDRQRPYLREWLPWVDETQSYVNTATFIANSRQQFADGRGFQAGIFLDDALVGVIGFHDINHVHRFTSIGYWLSSDVQGRGIMTRACRALVQHALVDLGLNRVEIRAAVENCKSRAIPERLGFELEGAIRQAEWLHDHFVDHAVYGMLARDWR
jgi:ribosomal-protein-serine acetyltransferase